MRPFEDYGVEAVAGVEAGEGAEGAVLDGFGAEGGEAGDERGYVDAGVCGGDGGEDLLVFFGLERAGGVEEVAAGGEAGERGGEDCALAGGLAGEVGGLEAVADLGVAAEGAGAAAGDVAEDEVEEAFGGSGRAVASAMAGFDVRRRRGSGGGG